MFTRAFLRELIERALKTFCQALAGSITALGLVQGMTWGVTLLSAAFATLYSVVTSIASYPATGTASLVKEKPKAPRRRKRGTQDSSYVEGDR